MGALTVRDGLRPRAHRIAEPVLAFQNGTGIIAE